MPDLVLTRGLPRSGKTTFALSWVAEDPRRRRVNRDDLRWALFRAHAGLDPGDEMLVTALQRQAVRTHLTAGRDVVVDDLHLRARYLRGWADAVADVPGVTLRIVDVPTPVQTCVDRDARADRVVGETVIRDLARRFGIPDLGRLPPPPDLPVRAPSARYAPPSGGVPAYLVDLDGTLALMHGRSPYDWPRVGEDAVNEPVARVVRDLARSHAVVYVSGRDGSCRDETADWLRRHGLPAGDLHMRPPGDTRRDEVVKHEIFDREIRDRYEVLGVFDDRDRVVRMWRDLGLTVFQVADGAF